MEDGPSRGAAGAYLGAYLGVCSGFGGLVERRSTEAISQIAECSRLVETSENGYLQPMRMPCELCLATAAPSRVPAGPGGWLLDSGDPGRQARAAALPQRHRLVEALPLDCPGRAMNREKRFAIDGEAVILGVDGVSDFNALHSRKHDHEAQLYAFDILAMGGDDLRNLPLFARKTKLETGSPWRPSSATRSGWTYILQPAAWGLRASSRNAAIGLTAAVGRSTGLR